MVSIWDKYYSCINTYTCTHNNVKPLTNELKSMLTSHNEVHVLTWVFTWCHCLLVFNGARNASMTLNAHSLLLGKR